MAWRSGDGGLGRRTVSGGHATGALHQGVSNNSPSWFSSRRRGTYVRVLVPTTVGQQLGVFGHQGGAGIVIEQTGRWAGRGLDLAGQVLGGSGDAGHPGVGV